MPARDRTGPGGEGARTGRGLGDCTGQRVDSAGIPGRGFGRGWGRGFGRGMGLGRGWGRGWGLGRRWGGTVSDTAPVDDEIEGLRSESSRLKTLLEAVERRLSSFDKRD